MEQNNIVKAKRPLIWHATLAVTVMAILAQVFGIITGAAVQLFPGQFSDFGADLLSLTGTQLCVMLPVPFLFLYLSRCDVRGAVRLKKGINAVQVILLMCISAGAVPFANSMNSLFLELLGSLGYTPINSYMTNPTNDLQAIAGVLVIAVLPAFAEEFLFRGLVMRSFERYSPWVAAVCSALLFGVMHGTWEQVFFAFILGLVLSYVVLITDSLWASMTIHFTNNAFSVLATYFITKYAPHLLTETESTASSEVLISAVTGVAIGAVMLAVFLSLFTLYTRYRNQQKYGSPLPENLTVKPPVQPLSHPVLQYLPLVLFCGLELLQMMLLWLHPEWFGLGG